MATDRLADLEQAAWAGFLRTHERLWRALSTGLASLDISMAEFDVLLAVDNADTDGVRMSVLAERRLMSTGGFTRLADRLESRGLIERRRSTSDGRSLDVVLTADGRALLARARRRHHADLRDLFFDHLDDDQLRNLATIWEVLSDESAPEDRC